MPHPRLDALRRGIGALAAATLLGGAAGCGGAEEEPVPVDPTVPIDTTAREGLSAAPAPIRATRPPLA